MLLFLGGIACGEKQPPKPVAVANARAHDPGGPHAEQADAVERAIEALDRGDIARAEALLGDSHRLAAAPLVEAMRRIEGRADGPVASFLVNVKATAVPRPPFHAAVPRKAIAGNVAVRVQRREAGNPPELADVLVALGDPSYDTRGARGRAESMAGGRPPANLPASYGAEPLVMALPQRDDRWLLLYGRDIGQARFVAVVDARTSPASPAVRVFDFASFLEPPDVVAPKETFEGIRWAELESDRLYVSTSHTGDPDASHGKNAYVTAVDIKSNTVVWQSEGQVADGGSFVVAGRHVVSAYEDYEYMRLFVLDKESGKTLSALPIPVPARALWVQGEELKASMGSEQLTIAGVPELRDDASRTHARNALPGLTAAAKLSSFSLDAAAQAKRTTAVGRWEAKRPLEAAQLLRASIAHDGAAGNFATEALLVASERRVEGARADAEPAVTRAKSIAITRATSARPAPIHQGPPLRLRKVSEAKNLPIRSSSIFDERKIPDAEIDKPFPGHTGDLPDYVPARLGTAILFNARYVASSRALIAIYGGQTVLFDVESRAPSVRLDFTPLGAAGHWPQVHCFELDGNVAFASGGSATATWFTAFDRESGSVYWTNDMPISNLLLIDGWLVVTTKSDIAVIDAVTGTVASRMPIVRADRIVRQGDEIVGGGPTSRVVLAITR